MVRTVITTLFLLCAFSTLISLGWWQIERLQWKENIIAELDNRNDQNPAETPLVLNEDVKEFDRGFIEGQFLYTMPPLFVGPRTHQKESGYHVHQPFRTTNGVTIMINRGWIPASMRNQTVPLPQLKKIGGHLRHPQKMSMGVQNRPESNLWYWADIGAINEYYKINATNLVLYQEVGYDGEYPVLFDGLPYPRNKHFQYAVFWFGMAFLLLILCLLRYRVKQS